MRKVIAIRINMPTIISPVLVREDSFDLLLFTANNMPRIEKIMANPKKMKSWIFEGGRKDPIVDIYPKNMSKMKPTDSMYDPNDRMIFLYFFICRF
jgi:hypothetical protein